VEVTEHVVVDRKTRDLVKCRQAAGLSFDAVVGDRIPALDVVAVADVEVLAPDVHHCGKAVGDGELDVRQVPAVPAAVSWTR
jgi:hypothetical protein